MVVQSLWFFYNNNDFSIIEYLSIYSYLHNGHKFVLYLYFDLVDKEIINKIYSNIKKCKNWNNFVIKDANEIIKSKKLFYDYDSNSKNISVAAFSDYFRYKMLYKVGGAWTDLDMINLKNLDLLKQEIIIPSENRLDGSQHATGSFLKWSDKHIKDLKKIIRKSKSIIYYQYIVYILKK